MGLIAAIGAFVRQFIALIPSVGPRLILAWLLTFVVLMVVFVGIKPRVRGHLMKLDTHIRDWARLLRYRDEHDHTTDRVLRTWFFRFWTNFASAPSLIVLSLGLAIWALKTEQAHATLYFFPGFCYMGSSFLSLFSKKIFKRPRPVRAEGSFGHKMTDASFPSGHSLTSFCFWTGCVLAAAQLGAGAIVYAALAVFAILTVFFTGLSRIYMGVHFPSDVVGGYVIGLVWCVVCHFALIPVL